MNQLEKLKMRLSLERNTLKHQLMNTYKFNQESYERVYKVIQKERAVLLRVIKEIERMEGEANDQPT